jgi:hypothetical protein
MPEVLCAGQEILVKVNINNGATGTLILMISSDNGLDWNMAAETENSHPENEFYISFHKGAYLLKAVLKSDLSGCESDNYNRVVTECFGCNELFLEPNLSGNDFLVVPGERKRFTVEYNVVACGDEYNQMNLHGSLIENAIYKSSFPEGAEIQYDDQQTLISWKIGDITDDFSQTYQITFEYLIPDSPTGTHIPLTGSWVLDGKTSRGLPVAAGDCNEIYVQVNNSDTQSL